MLFIWQYGSIATAKRNTLINQPSKLSRTCVLLTFSAYAFLKMSSSRWFDQVYSANKLTSEAMVAHISPCFYILFILVGEAPMAVSNRLLRRA
jgi:hypothetical protein